MRNDTQIEECVRHSDIVYNLVGRDYETKRVHILAVILESRTNLHTYAETSNSLKCMSKALAVSHASQLFLAYPASYMFRT